MRRSAQRGFTLTEIVVAIAVLAILAGAMTPLVVKQIEKSRKSRSQQDLRVIKVAFEQYFADTGRWPCNWRAGASNTWNGELRNFQCMYENTANLTGWDGPYLNNDGGQRNGQTVMAQQVNGEWQGVIDAWGRSYRAYLRAPGGAFPNGVIMLYSRGSDGAIDTNANQLANNDAQDDDVLMVVTKATRG